MFLRRCKIFKTIPSGQRAWEMADATHKNTSQNFSKKMQEPIFMKLGKEFLSQIKHIPERKKIRIKLTL